jgi:hypothetical protein
MPVLVKELPRGAKSDPKAPMMEFVLEHGTFHEQTDEDGVERRYMRGEVVPSRDDLEVKFVNKFRRLHAGQQAAPVIPPGFKLVPIEEAAGAPPPLADAGKGPAVDPKPKNARLLPPDIDKWPTPKLLEFAAEEEIDLRGLPTKADMVAKIKAASQFNLK